MAEKWAWTSIGKIPADEQRRILNERLQRLAGKVNRRPLDIIDLRDFDVDPRGINDSAGGLRAAFGSVPSTGARVYGPPGTYVTGTTQKIKSKTMLEGAGRGTVFKNGSATIGVMFENADRTNGNTDIALRSLTIDGNSALWQAGDPDVGKNTYTGVYFENVDDSAIADVHVTGLYAYEAQIEAGILLDACERVDLHRVRGTNNKMSVVYWYECDDCSLVQARFFNNGGSGFTSTRIARCAFDDIHAYASGDSALTSLVFSGVSINGPDCVVGNIVSWGHTGSGLALGHNNAPVGGRDDTADRVQAANIRVFGNGLDGITVQRSTDFRLTNVESSGNTRNGVDLRGSAARGRLVNVRARDNVGGANSSGFNVNSDAGDGHHFIACEGSGNQLYGINGTRPDCRVRGGSYTNNNQGGGVNGVGILVNDVSGWVIEHAEFDDDQGVPTQNYGVWLAGTTIAEATLLWNRFGTHVSGDVRTTATVTTLTRQDFSGGKFSQHVAIAAGKQLHAALGTAALPGVSFDGRTNQGMYSLGSNTVGFAVNGAETARITTEDWQFAKSIKANGFQQNVITTASNVTLTATTHTIRANGTLTVTLPAAASHAGRIYHIKQIGVGTVTITPNGTDTIDGAASQSLATQYHSYTIASDGVSDWSIIGKVA